MTAPFMVSCKSTPPVKGESSTRVTPPPNPNANKPCKSCGRGADRDTFDRDTPLPAPPGIQAADPSAVGLRSLDNPGGLPQDPELFSPFDPSLSTGGNPFVSPFSPGNTGLQPVIDQTGKSPEQILFEIQQREEQQRLQEQLRTRGPGGAVRTAVPVQAAPCSSGRCGVVPLRHR